MSLLPPNPLQTERWVLPVNALHYSYVFRTLFSHPKLACAILSVRRFWLAPLLLSLAMSILGSLLITLDQIPQYGSDIRRGSSFILQKIGSLKFEDGRIVWPEEADAQLPAQTGLTHCRLDIVDRWDSFVPDWSLSPHLGLVLSHDGLGIWACQEDTSLKTRQLALPAKRLAGMDTSAMTLTPHTQVRFCKFVFMALFGGLLLSQLLAILKIFFSTAVVLTIVWMVMGRARSFRAIPSLFLLAWNLALPPMLVSLLWSITGLSGDFELLFTVAFFLYILYAIIEGRKAFLTHA